MLSAIALWYLLGHGDKVWNFLTAFTQIGRSIGHYMGLYLRQYDTATCTNSSP